MNPISCKGFLIRTPRGRVATSRAFDHMDMKAGIIFIKNHF
ncbi:MAG: hypothetical protein R3A45_06835 [Bdellovibrionota bacterium]